ncbi:FixH protein [Lutibacter oricola]|uniref:FixH protein n=1 Tax=Lutibacter oricola TaxID=762486 RepID=A0A1H2VWI3_9FLAO|nr:FixH family protein [Lutibacter oricola]SDW72314.1 FixH protein [Lutibacter oricola]
MKFKFTWPMGIIIALVSFMIFISTFLYLSFTPKYSHNLTSEDYYKDELNYQQEIDLEERGNSLKENVSIKKVEKGLLISFPSEFEPSKISGTISFKRLSNEKIDFTKPIKLKTNKLLISDDILVEGRWDVNINWNVNEVSYLYKEKLIY